MDLRYGTNPHQAARMSWTGAPPFRILSGHPSAINVLDAVNAWALVREAAEATGQVTATSFKHVSPAGAALDGPLDDTLRECWSLDEITSPVLSAYARARDADPKSSFGDFIAVSHPVDLPLASFLAGVVSDGIIAPGFEPGVLAVLRAKRRGTFLVLEADPKITAPPWERRELGGVILEQEVDHEPIRPDLLQVSVGRPLSAKAVQDAILGMITVRYTQSNSVAFVQNARTVGIGAGQQSPVDCTRLAGTKTDTWWLRRHPSLPGQHR